MSEGKVLSKRQSRNFGNKRKFWKKWIIMWVSVVIIGAIFMALLLLWIISIL